MLIESIFDIIDENTKNEINNVPALAFQCKIAKIRPAKHGQLLRNWSDEANNMLNYASYTNIFCGTVSSIILNLKKI